MRNKKESREKSAFLSRRNEAIIFNVVSFRVVFRFYVEAPLIYSLFHGFVYLVEPISFEKKNENKNKSSKRRRFFFVYGVLMTK